MICCTFFIALLTSSSADSARKGHTFTGYVPSEAESGIVSIAAGYYYSLALTSSGEVVAWGTDEFGQCSLAPSSGIKAIGDNSGYHHAAALTTSGGVVAWGLAQMGTEVPAAAQSGITAISVGAAHIVALNASGGVVAWGGTVFEPFGPLVVPVRAQSGIVAVAASTNDAFALSLTGEVIYLGVEGNYGKHIGLPGQPDVPSSALSGVAAIAAGGHIVAIKGVVSRLGCLAVICRFVLSITDCYVLPHVLLHHRYIVPYHGMSSCALSCTAYRYHACEPDVLHTISMLNSHCYEVESADGHGSANRDQSDFYLSDFECYLYGLAL